MRRGRWGGESPCLAPSHSTRPRRPKRRRIRGASERSRAAVANERSRPTPAGSPPAAEGRRRPRRARARSRTAPRPRGRRFCPRPSRSPSGRRRERRPAPTRRRARQPSTRRSARSSPSLGARAGHERGMTTDLSLPHSVDSGDAQAGVCLVPLVHVRSRPSSPRGRERSQAGLRRSHVPR